MDFVRAFGFLLVLLLTSFVIHYVVYVRGYEMGYSFDSISDSLFMVGVVGFFPSLMAQIGSYKVFYGFQYALRSLFSNDFRQKYRFLSDFLSEKKPHAKSTVFLELLLSSAIVLLLAILFGLMWGRQL